MIKKLFASPQPLFMDSHAYAPKVLPLYWRSPDFVIWEGSFIYREGMKKAYLGFHIKMDGMQSSNGLEYEMSDFGNDTDAINVGIIVKHTIFSYKNIYNADDVFDKYFASAPIHKVANVTRKSSTYTFRIKDGQATNLASNAEGYLDKNARVSEIEIDLTKLNFEDGELVPIKMYLLVGDNPNKSDRTKTALFKTYYENFNNFFAIRPNNPLDADTVLTEGIFYSHLYAYTDGDLSYTDNWASVSGVITSGNSVLSTTNMSKLTGKQRYITDRLKNRPMPLAGSILYLSALGGTSSVKYPAEDNIPGEWEYSKEEYAHTISNDVDEYAVGADNLFRTVNAAARINIHSNLATYAWNPAFSLYSQPTVSFKFYGNTAARQVLIVDFTESPVSQTSTRATYIYGNNGQLGRSGHVHGYFGGVSGGPSMHTGFYGSVYAAHDMTQFVTKPGSQKVYKNHLFQVRIPSANTRIYSPEYGRSSTEREWFLGKGFWEDQVQINFEQKRSATEWGLQKDGNGKTLQYGFIGDYPVSAISGYFPWKTYENEINKQYVFNKINNDFPNVTKYNDTDWNWFMSSGTRGYSQVFINLYDHNGPFYKSKANYISYCFLVGMDDFKLADSLISIPAKYQSSSLMTYSGVVTAIKSINDSLNESYNQLFINNPHFTYYNMFWGAPKSTLNMRHIYKAYSDKFFFFSRRRTGNILIVRGKNVTMYYGEIKQLKREGNPFGSLHKIDDVDVEFEFTESLISGDSEETRIIHLSSIENLAYNQRYYIKGDTVIYAAEFFEEPS